MKLAARKVQPSLAAAGLAACLVALPTGEAIAQEEEETPIRGSIAVDLASKATISADDARRAASTRYPDATISEVELEVEDGFLFYVVEMGEEDGEDEVLVDAGDSSIVVAEEEEEEAGEEEEEDEGEEEPDEDDVRGTIPMDLASMVRIDQDAARQAVLAELPGATVQEIELVVEDGYLVYEAEAESAGEIYEVIVDAGDSRILLRETED